MRVYFSKKKKKSIRLMLLRISVFKLANYTSDAFESPP